MNRDTEKPPVAQGKLGFVEKLDDDVQALLRSVAQPMSFRKGAVLARHGQLAHGTYLLRSGDVEALVRLPSGDRVVVAQLSAGDVFGDMAAVDSGTYSATVRATSDVDVWFVEGEDFRALAAQRSQAALRLQHAVTLLLIERLRRLNDNVLARPAPEDRPARPPIPPNALASVARTKTAPFELRPFLPRLEFFETFDERDINEVLSRGSLLELPRGHPLFGIGEPGHACYLVVRGAVEVLCRAAERERRLAVLGPGQLVGFMSVLERGNRGTDAYARENTLLLELDREALSALSFEVSAVANKVQHAIHRNLLDLLAQTNRVLTRLISEARLAGAWRESDELAATYSGQIVAAEKEKSAV